LLLELLFIISGQKIGVNLLNEVGK
jgi:hypothetical protein